jgi:hypothetical protein
MAEKVLIMMTIPCHRALVARVVWCLHTNGQFPEFFAKAPKARKWFRPTVILFRRAVGTKQSRYSEQTRRDGNWFNGRQKLTEFPSDSAQNGVWLAGPGVAG